MEASKNVVNRTVVDVLAGVKVIFLLSAGKSQASDECAFQLLNRFSIAFNKAFVAMPFGSPLFLCLHDVVLGC
jgi:hypothetical protein